MAGPSPILIVVGRDQGDLYQYFRWGFGHTPGVEVVLDRRLGQRRGPLNGHRPVAERRRTDRRRAGATRAELLARGFLIVQRDPGADARDWGTLR